VAKRLRHVFAVAAALLLCSAVTAACARPLGDFGRPRDSIVHDRAMPALGKARARLFGEPVSTFNLTDQEEELHDRVWRFLVAPHANDWFMDTVVELQRTRLAGRHDPGFKPDRYFKWLQRQRYQSSRIRFRTIADHANSDVDTAPATFRAICRVLEVDRQRAVASRELHGLAHDEVAKRRAENGIFIAWFTRALRYRYEAYGYALDRLLVETPHEEAIEADAEITALAIYVERAEDGDFCSGNGLSARDDDAAIPSRVLLGPPAEGGYLK
jgi:hypothetical protein